MFLINETLNREKIPQGKEEELFQQHVAWFTRHFEQGNFLLVGPYTDQEMAGIMLSGLENREALEAVLKEDVYYADGMADYEVHAFKAGKIARDSDLVWRYIYGKFLLFSPFYPYPGGEYAHGALGSGGIYAGRYDSYGTHCPGNGWTAVGP